MYIVKKESDLLDPAIRKKCIESFVALGNARRKDDAFKAYECLKDKTINYVLELLLKQFDISTVQEMQYAMSNISILRKVIEKLAKVYANGVKRTMKVKSDTAAIEEAADYLNMDAAMKKANKYFRTFKNALIYVRPIKNDDKYDIQVQVLPPFKYDAVENPDNPETPLAIVLSDYLPTRKPLYALGDAAVAGRSSPAVRELHQVNAPIQQTMPNTGIVGQGNGTAEDDKREFIWWSKNYHFTTNAKGEIIAGDHDEDDAPEDGTANPIGALPFVNLAGEQDGTFWAEGGSDLVDTGVKVNVDITNVKHIGNQQGYGQMYMTGKNLPKSVKVGPTHCIQLEQSDKDEPAPTVGILSSQPPLSELKELIEMQVALMLSTNNLSTHGFSVSLTESGKSFASGIAIMLDKSESTEDIEEQAKVFMEAEPDVWVLFYLWLGVYKSAGLLSDDAALLKQVKKPEDVQLEFPQAAPIVAETDELTAIEQRKTLGMNTMLELIMRDRPGLSEEEAQAKLDEIKAEKAANQADMLASGVDASGNPVQNPNDPSAQGGDVNGNQGQKGNGFGGKNDNNAGTSGGTKDTGSGKDPNQK